jgi:hypothetical protein
MKILLIVAVAIACSTWLGLGLIDRPEVLGEIKTDDLAAMSASFRSAIKNGYKWVEAVPGENGKSRVIGHTTRRGRDKTCNWLLGKPSS